MFTIHLPMSHIELNIYIMKYLIIICLCTLCCVQTSCRRAPAKKQVTEVRRPLRYYKGHIVVGVWPTKNTVVLANDSVYVTLAVTDYELTTVALGDTVK